MDGELQILREACQALARLDADRLEELAATCRVLNREISQDSSRGRLAAKQDDCRKQLKVLGRIVERTRDNLAVIHRVQDRARGTHAPDVFTRDGF